MKSFLFITDFDGTITAQDFFVQILFRYKPEKAFLKNNKHGLELFSDVFGDLNLTEDEILSEIEHVAFDPSFVDLVEFVKKNNGEVLILSAGAYYYVENKLKMENLNDKVMIIANKSFYDKKTGTIKLIRNEYDKFYDAVFGINKLKVVEHYKKKFDVLAYAGDSYVDFDACRLCDFKFAKKNLHKIFDMLCLRHNEFSSFLEIKRVLEKKLNLS